MAMVLVLVVEDQTVATEVLDGFTVKLLLTVSSVTVAWIITTLASRPESKETLRNFYKLTHPGGPGWAKVVAEAKADGVDINEKEEGKAWEMPQQVLLIFLGCAAIYSSLFSIGGFIYGEIGRGILLATVAVVCTFFLFRILNKLRVG
ncbi:MAG: Na+:solute symporter, partial [Cyclobacteriaceae bacterium]|nr:Na+:solute symporter [Cyclobacteriaceae bacterium]